MIGAPLKVTDLPELVRVDDVARWLGVSKGVVYDMCRRGDLPSCRIGRLIRVPRSALEAMVAGRKWA